MIKVENLKSLREILSAREIEVVRKRLQGKRINQTESNYLSRSVRPKLRAAQIAVSLGLLKLLDYRRKKYERENRLLRKMIVAAVEKAISVKNVKAIVVYGSYVRNFRIDYRDIDILIVLKRKLWRNLIERENLERNIEMNCDLNIDVRLIVYRDMKKTYAYSPFLQSVFENYNLIYGDLELTKGIKIDRTYLYYNLHEPESVLELGKDLDSKYIYNAIRTCLTMELFLEKKMIRNDLIVYKMAENIGNETVRALAENRASKIQREIGLSYLKELYTKLEKRLRK